MAKKFDFKRIGMKVAGVGVGAVAGKIADKPMANMNPKLRGIIKVGVGAVVPELMPKNEFIGAVGAGILAIGASDLYDSFTGKTGAPVSGIGVYPDNALGSPSDTALGATEDYQMTEMSGTEDYVTGIGDTE